MKDTSPKKVYMCKPNCTTLQNSDYRDKASTQTLAITGSFGDHKVKPTMLQDDDTNAKRGIVETAPCDYLGSWAVSGMAF